MNGKGRLSFCLTTIYTYACIGNYKNFRVQGYTLPILSQAVGPHPQPQSGDDFSMVSANLIILN